MKSNHCSDESVTVHVDKSVIEDVISQDPTESWLHCEICIYKCKREKTMAKHMNEKHKDFEACDICGKNIGDGNVMKEHKNVEHIMSKQDKVKVINQPVNNIEDSNDKDEVGNISDVSLDEELLDRLTRECDEFYANHPES